MKVIERPNLQLYEGVKITKDLKLEFKNDTTVQTVENLVLTTTLKKKDVIYDMETTTHVHLQEGKYLVYDEENGYIYPLNEAYTLDDAIKEIEEYKNSLDKEE